MNSRSTEKVRRRVWSALSIGAALALLMGGWPTSLPDALAAGTIRGTVYRDFNLNGVRDSGEVGVAGVSVTAADSAGASQGAATTGADGTYALATGGTGPYRVEFTNIPAPYKPGPHGANNNTTVQFVPNGDSNNVDLGVNDPTEYCQSLPFLATSCQANGNPLGGGTAGQHASVYAVPYNASGSDHSQAITVAQGTDLGAVWGLAYRRASSTLFVSALARRHSGFGSLGTGGLYRVQIDPVTGARVSVAPFVDLNSIGVNTGADPHVGLPAAADQPSNDAAMFDAVAKISVGDIELSEDERTLYVTNLNDRRVYALQVADANGAIVTPTAANVTGYDILPLPAGSQACAAADVRPWALKAHAGGLLIGVVCSGQSTQSTASLYGYILRLDPTSGARTLVSQFPLNYPRGCASRVGGSCYDAEWRPWTADLRSLCVDQNADGVCELAYNKHIIYPQPIISSIDLDADGAMVLSLLDRNGMQTGYQNYDTNGTGPVFVPLDGSALPPAASPLTRYDGAAAGDILRLCRSGSGYVLESNGSCPGLLATGGANETPVQGLGGGEWFWQDHHPVTGPIEASVHDETGVGAAKVMLAEGEVAATLYNPLGEVNTGGLGWFVAADGTRPRSFELFDVSVTGSFGKAGGLGDLEPLCLPAPIEIGNYVWLDSDRDGVQDPQETPFADIIVRLYTPGTDGRFGTADDVLVGTTTTDAVGRYYFSNLLPQTNYQVRIDTAQAPLIGYLLTSTDSDPSANGDSRDNDGLPQGLDAVITLRTGNPGDNNHTYDFGFVESPTAVELEYFTIEGATANTVTLAWQTASETDHFGFELVRSTSPTFETGTVIYAIAGSHPDGQLYRYIDTLPVGSGPWHYRLIEVDTSDTRSVVGTASTALSGLFVEHRLYLPFVQP